MSVGLHFGLRIPHNLSATKEGLPVSTGMMGTPFEAHAAMDVPGAGGLATVIIQNSEEYFHVQLDEALLLY